jgi:hypothetical protein
VRCPSPSYWGCNESCRGGSLCAMNYGRDCGRGVRDRFCMSRIEIIDQLNTAGPHLAQTVGAKSAVSNFYTLSREDDDESGK